MNPVPFVVLRHGPTAWNGAGRLQGRADIPLDADGIATARRWRLPPQFVGYRWLTSPLGRAVETARLLGLDAAVEPALIETDWGHWEGRSLAALRATDPSMAEREAAGLDLAAPGGESPRAVQARLTPLLATIATACLPTGGVTHKGVIRALLSLATGWDMTGAPPVRLDWSSAHLFALDGNGRPHLEQANIPLRQEASSNPCAS
ncbi:MAG TPA: histidine phosphatase family protein [Stellaceae bacterium]|nr:histidine phosphatase family protein [Stellaceae bacterium]